MAAKKKAAKKRAAKKKAAKKRGVRRAKPASEIVGGDRLNAQPVSPPTEVGGRPTDYTPELANIICERLSCGESLLRISKDDDMPHRHTVRRWLMGIGVSQIDPDELSRFSSNYALARQMYEENVFEELGDVKHDIRLDPQAIARAKLWSDNVKWILARMNRAKYGDKADINLGGQGPEKPIELSTTHNISDEDRAELEKIGRRIATGGKL